jgi:hypothetical protein
MCLPVQLLYANKKRKKAFTEKREAKGFKKKNKKKEWEEISLYDCEIFSEI